LPYNYYSEDSDFGVIYYLDCNRFYGFVNDLIHTRLFPKLITVGIDFDRTRLGGGNSYRRVRSLYLTPTSWGPGGPYWPDKAEDTGKAQEFLKCIEKEIIPLIESEYRADPEDRTLVGHSYGGLFSLYAIFESPGLFDRVVAASPSIPWDANFIHRLEAQYAKSKGELPIRLYTATGRLEEFPEDPMVSSLMAFGDQLKNRNYNGLSFKIEINEGENHGTNSFITYVHGLRWVFSDLEK
jgi:predicted alpha/beta superfamily hydrolase